MHWSLSLILIIGSRIFGKTFALGKDVNNSKTRKNVVVYGAGSAGRQLVIALSHSSEYNPVAFLDDSKDLQNNFIDRIEVYNPNHFGKLIKSMEVDEVLLAIPSATRTRRNEILKFLDLYPVFVRALPGVAEIAQGKVKIDDLHEINIRFDI